MNDYPARLKVFSAIWQTDGLQQGKPNIGSKILQHLSQHSQKGENRKFRKTGHFQKFPIFQFLPWVYIDIVKKLLHLYIFHYLCIIQWKDTKRLKVLRRLLLYVFYIYSHMRTQSIHQMSSINLGIEAMKIFNKAIDIFAASASEIKAVQDGFLKFQSEEEKKEKERNKTPKVYFERECPYPDNPAPTKKQGDNKANEASQNANRNDGNQTAAKKPPQYLSYGGANMAKAVQKPTIPKPVLQNHASNEKAEKEAPKQPVKKDNKSPAARDEPAQENSGNIDLKRQKSAPMRPKQPLSAFIRFNKAHIDDVRKEYPHMAQTDLVTVTGHMWNSLPAEVKRKFEDEYQRDKERYQAELAEFYRKNPHEKKSKKQLLKEKQSAINAQKK